MKVLIFGAGGMIGHKMFESLLKNGFDVFGTLKQPRRNYATVFPLFGEKNSFENLDILDREAVLKVLNSVRPDAILNCVGITLRKPEITSFDYCEKVNGDFPKFLQSWCEENKSYLVHFSTDCVFSGHDGPYTEASLPSATDIYGQTKTHGEVRSANALTLRGSMIGPELFGKTELLEWALAKKGQKIKGFSNVIYSGVTTGMMADLVGSLLLRQEKLTGLYQVSSKPISKFHLLQLLSVAFDLNLIIEENAAVHSEKILISLKLREKIGFYCPEWSVMVKNLATDMNQPK